MSDKARTSLLSLAIIVVLVFSAVSPLTVYADEGTPTEKPPAETTGDTGTSTEESTDPQSTKEVPPADTEGESSTEEGADPQKTEGSEATDGEASTEKAADSVSAEEAAPAEGETTADPEASLLSDVPKDTVVTVLDSKGEAQPLATQEAAEAISTSDPIWCPGSQAPTPGDNGCTQNFASFDELLTFLSGNSDYQGAGTIYVQQGNYQGNDPDKVIDFNSPSYDLSNISNSNLTVTGGWNTSTNTIDPNNPTVFSEYSFLIGSSANPWGGSLFLNNISIVYEGVPDWSTGIDGITLHTDEDITLSNVNVTAAPDVGAELHAGGNVNIQNSNFQQNSGGGAVIRSGGNVNVANSSFGNPFPDRDRWQSVGLDIENDGATSLFAVMANGNREAGAHINSGGRVTIGSSFFNGTKSIWDNNGQTVFLGYGLHIITPDSVDLLDVTGNDNFLWGANVEASGDIAIADSVFNVNTTDDPGFIDDTGLFITGGGDVSLRNVEASDNRLYGAQIEAEGIVSISDSTFNNNRGEIIDADGSTTYHGHGLQVNSLANIFIFNTEAVNNMLFGGELTAGGEVAVDTSTFSDTSTGSDTDALGVGLEITSGGNASLANVILDNNQTAGADIQAGGDIFLDLVTATNNGTNGVVAQVDCTHVFGGLYAGNGQYGLVLNNSAIDIISPPTFAGNGAGDIFPDNPASCSPALNINSSAGSGNLFVTSLMTAGTAFGSIDLSTYMASTNTGSGANGLFIGKYHYVHSDAGIQIIAIDASSNDSFAMAGP
jgi:hypothetical protein